MPQPNRFAGVPPLAVVLTLLIVLACAGVVLLRSSAPPLAWSVDLGAPPSGAGTGEGIAVASAQDESVRAIDLATGATLWTNGDLRAVGAPRVQGGRVYVATLDEVLVALGAESGEELWSVGDVRPQILAAAGEEVVVGTYTGFVVAHAGSGRVLWSYDRRNDTDERQVTGALAVDEDAVYVGYERRLDYALTFGGRSATEGGVYAVDRVTGRRIWDADLDAKVVHAPVPSGDLLVVATIDALAGNLFVLDRADGAVRWKEVGGEGAPAVLDGVVCFVRTDGRTTKVGPMPVHESRHFYAGLEIATGEELWRRPVSHEVRGAVPCGALALFEQGRELHAVRASSGRRAWSLELAAPVAGPPAVSPEQVVVVTEDGGVHALRLD